MTKKRGMASCRYLQAINAEFACAHCGNAEQAVLHWHHKDPAQKLFHVNNTDCRRHGLASFAAEAAKCVRLCCNCHLMAHAGLIDVSGLE